MSHLDFLKNIFKKKDIDDLDKMVKAGLITYEEKLRLEADRTAKRLDKYIAKKNKKRKP